MSTYINVMPSLLNIKFSFYERGIDYSLEFFLSRWLLPLYNNVLKEKMQNCVICISAARVEYL